MNNRKKTIDNSTLHTVENHYNKIDRAISNSQLNMSPYLHFYPINVIVYNGSNWET